MLALTAQVSATTVKNTSTWKDSGGGYHTQDGTQTFDVGERQVESDTYKDSNTWSHHDHGSNTRTGTIPNEPPFVGPGGEQPIEGGGPVELVRVDDGGDY